MDFNENAGGGGGEPFGSIRLEFYGPMNLAHFLEERRAGHEIAWPQLYPHLERRYVDEFKPREVSLPDHCAHVVVGWPDKTRIRCCAYSFGDRISYEDARAELQNQMPDIDPAMAAHLIKKDENYFMSADRGLGMIYPFTVALLLVLEHSRHVRWQNPNLAKDLPDYRP